jgi:glycosyltransferase involved in cell wall biosynthesis
MTTRTRVLHVIDSLDLGGAQVVLLNLLEHADRKRFEVEAACLHGHGVFWKRLCNTGLPIHSLSPHRLFPIYIPALASLILRRRYEIVHCHLLGANLIAKPLATLLGVPIRINHDHCNDKRDNPHGIVATADRFANRLSTHICAVSETTRSFLLESENIARDKVSTIQNGINLKAFQPRPHLRSSARSRWDLPPDAFVVGGIGRLTYQKNFSLFLDVACAVIKLHPHAVFVIAGTGEDDSALRAQAANLDLGSRIRFLGHIEEISLLYPALDMLLLPSRYEGLPITVLEAMAVGLPIVASRLDGIAEVLVDGESGCLVEPGDRDAFVACIHRSISHPDRSRRYSEVALAKVRKEHSAEAMTRSVESIYSHALKLDR